MTKKTALLISIGKYNRMADILEMNIGVPIEKSFNAYRVKDFIFSINKRTCALCQKYEFCKGCPVEEVTGSFCCKNTPHEVLYNSLEFSNNVSIEACSAARAEANFLRALL